MTRAARDLAGVVLAAGAGTRLRPLTRERPKALCPVDGVPLVDLALDRLRPLAGGEPALAVNLHHGAEQLDAHLPPAVHRSREAPEARGTAGAIGALRTWLDGRDVAVANADAWLDRTLDLDAFVAEWDRERTRLLCVTDPARGDFGDLRYCGVALIPAATARGLSAAPSGLYEASWRHEHEAGRLDLVATDVRFIDCGTPADYLAANLAASGGRSVVADDTIVGDGSRLDRVVVWPGSEIAPGEVLADAVRTPRVTVLVREMTR
ncbi:sugar phosphate nucleotidyltransferase [Aquihabitans daechungensis]|uniref:sugar phosphate nucleotidyltransferase n=1 Tax=Aquihabitans daechungensis TaxID=1052257 RepID=UPI003B9F303D